MILAVVLGWPVMLFTGTTQSFFWTFFGLRLLSDLGSLRPTERERIRAQMFGPPYAPGARESAVTAPGTAVDTAPPRFSPAHARHDVKDSQP